MREAWKHGSGKHMFGLSLFRPSRKERFKYPLPLENKVNQMPYPRANKDKSPPHALPPHIQVECEAFLDDKQMIKFDLSEDQIITFVCAIYKYRPLFSDIF